MVACRRVKNSAQLAKGLKRITRIAQIPSTIPWINTLNQQSLTSLSGSSKDDAYQFYLGAAGTGAPFHHHQSAWNALIYGRKHWFLVPPRQAIFSTKPVRQTPPVYSQSRACVRACVFAC